MLLSNISLFLLVVKIKIYCVIFWSLSFLEFTELGYGDLCLSSNLEKVFVVVLFFDCVFVCFKIFKQFLNPAWGSNLQPRVQESHGLPTGSARHPRLGKF